ncbi:hypothetical protein [Mycobacteroides abscessus]|uniref:hypothetical protein n=1 Tax=Mycobacteroides abscessus TaxID=36809 RepID=UPI0005E7807C|nr:hypothetical protein [Mycobacteroides abscessus]MDO3201358.1 hypothetical protein [Mycobacteroides abscessus subsp. abscessus]MDO3336853.1 hypothetical protein [Mycobacteroides abscessus subsp. abscessus]PVB43347.1 hypothetical protein DDJ39_09780 [Mycobacteroides abscessus]RIU19741.1 hypothetical protein D2E97_00605 [Mycobacteroides abscessus]CPR74348.1 O-methyltransferase [Mycobacteroides abscessus]
MSSAVGYGAYGTAAVLATEQYATSPPIIDPCAIRLLPPALHLRAFVDGFAMCQACAGYDEFVTQQQWWYFGPHPEEVAEFFAEYDWHLRLHVGAADYLQRYLRPVQGELPVSEIEREVIARRYLIAR